MAFISSYDTMDKIINKVRDQGYKVKDSVILDRGDWPAMTVETAERDIPADLLGFLRSLGYEPMNPVRYMKRKSGGYGVKFSVQTCKKEALSPAKKPPRKVFQAS